MGRGEKSLLACLVVCTACVGGLSWHTSAIARAGAARSTVAQSSEPPAGAAATSAAAEVSPHVSAVARHSSRAAPAVDPAAARRIVEIGKSDTFIDAMLLGSDSSISRWPERYRDPVKIWIQSRPGMNGWSYQLTSAAEYAFNAWAAIQLPVRFESVTDSAVAEIVVTWSDRFSDARVGATKRFRDQHGWIGRAEITLALFTSAGIAIDEQYVRAVAIHEVGHALGLDHSPNRGDIMSERNTGVFEPTPADRATLALIYRLPPGSLK